MPDADVYDAELSYQGPTLFHPSTVRGVLAYVIVAAAIAAIIVGLVIESPEMDIVTAFFTGLMGAVVGYFFGSRGVDQAEATTRRVLDTGIETKVELENAIREAATERALKRRQLEAVLLAVKESGDQALREKVAMAFKAVA